MWNSISWHLNVLFFMAAMTISLVECCKGKKGLRTFKGRRKIGNTGRQIGRKGTASGKKVGKKLEKSTKKAENKFGSSEKETPGKKNGTNEAGETPAKKAGGTPVKKKAGGFSSKKGQKKFGSSTTKKAGGFSSKMGRKKIGYSKKRVIKKRQNVKSANAFFFPKKARTKRFNRRMKKGANWVEDGEPQWAQEPEYMGEEGPVGTGDKKYTLNFAFQNLKIQNNTGPTKVNDGLAKSSQRSVPFQEDRSINTNRLKSGNDHTGMPVGEEREAEEEGPSVIGNTENVKAEEAQL